MQDIKSPFDTTMIQFTKADKVPLEEYMIQSGPLLGLNCLVNKRHALVYKDPVHANAIIIDYVEGERHCLNQYSMPEPGKLHWGMGDAAMAVFVIVGEDTSKEDGPRSPRGDKPINKHRSLFESILN